MAYCTLAEARAAGAVGTDAQVQEAIANAAVRVEAFTGDFFEPRVLTVVARVGGDGRAFMPHRVTSATAVTEVKDADTATVLGTQAWRTYSSVMTGEVDAVGVGPAHRGYNILVNGMEPWNRYNLPQRIQVTGTFGWATPPTAIHIATAMLAAEWTKAHRGDEDGNPATPNVIDTTSADPEGNVIPVVPPFGTDGESTFLDAVSSRRTTGNRRVDALLVDYRRDRPLTAV